MKSADGMRPDCTIPGGAPRRPLDPSPHATRA